MGGRGTVDGVDGDGLRCDALERLQPGGNVLIAGVVAAPALIRAAQEDGLHDDVPLVGGERLNLVFHVVGAAGAVEELDEVGVHGVELEDVVVHKHERLAHGGAVGHGGVGEHGDLAAGGVLVAQAHRGAHCLGERGRRRGFAVAGERDDVGQHAGLAHLAQLRLEGRLVFLGTHAALMGAAFGVEAVLAVQAVERADLARRRHEVDA